MKKLSFLLTLVCLLPTVHCFAYTERNLLQRMTDTEKLKEILVMNQEWVPYPAYTDREGWDKLFGDNKQMFIRRGEKLLDYEWKVVRATDYLAYERTGDRKIMEDPFDANNKAITDLLVAELAEGKGRFIDQIVNGVFHSCEMTSWTLSAHLASAQRTHRALPDEKENIIALVSGDMSAVFSWTYYFLHSEFDKIDPVIADRLRKEIYRRVLNPYMEEDRFWWMAFNYKEGDIVNNWNPWCNCNVLQSFMLLENDKDKLARAVYRTMTSVDKFINYINSDGACEEGPSYWGHAAGKLYDYLQVLLDATGGHISLFNNPMIKNMGEYISRSDVGNGWVVNFADASAKGEANAPLIYRYGKAVGSREMMEYAAFLNQKSPKKGIIGGRDLYRTLQSIRYQPELEATDAAHNIPPVTWYPETQFCYMKDNKGLFFACKGGYNNESHNHNDAGTFSLYLNTTPVIIDAGVGTYTRQTFSSERYSIWTMQSNYHNLPMINGIPQKFGSEYKATDVTFNPKNKKFSANLATAYPPETGVEKWIRSYTLDNGTLIIEDNFALAREVRPNQVNFMSWGQIDISESGKIKIDVNGNKVALLYDKAIFIPSVETIKLTDPRLSKVWGDEIYRISLTAKGTVKEGKYKFKISRL